MKFDSLITGEFDAGLNYDFFPAIDETSTRLLIVLHGRGDSPEGFHWLPGTLDLDAFHYLLLEAPEPYATGFSWYGMPPNQGPGIVESRQTLSRLLKNLQKTFHLASRDLFLFGFSQGCLMSIDVGLRYSEVLGGIVGVSGYVFFMEEYPQAFAPVAAQQKFFISHGTEDEVLPLARSKESVAKLRALGINIEWREYNKGHTLAEGEIGDIKNYFIQRMQAASDKADSSRVP